ncbi:hypothetical protein [Staphylococcus pseudintermedius]|uniref:hypothetical protein n=1 Tax=Staphylococcus pseudintermedius TaxID=283734 RepID=UPI001F5133E6
MTEELNDQMQVRRQKLQELRDLGIDPFGEKFERTGTAETLKAQWDQYAKEELAEKRNGKSYGNCRSYYDKTW